MQKRIGHGGFFEQPRKKPAPFVPPALTLSAERRVPPIPERLLAPIKKYQARLIRNMSLNPKEAQRQHYMLNCGYALTIALDVMQFHGLTQRGERFKRGLRGIVHDFAKDTFPLIERRENRPLAERINGFKNSVARAIAKSRIAESDKQDMQKFFSKFYFAYLSELIEMPHRGN